MGECGRRDGVVALRAHTQFLDVHDHVDVDDRRTATESSGHWPTRAGPVHLYTVQAIRHHASR